MAVSKKKTAPAVRAKSAKATGSVPKKAKKPVQGRSETRSVTKESGKKNEVFLSARVQAVVDKSEIADVLYAVGRGLDRLDESLLRGAFHPDATIDLGPGVFQGTSGDYIPWVLSALGQTRETHHLIGNVRVTLEHDVAFVESYVHGHHRLDKPTGREDVFIGSRFLDRMERRPSGTSGVWKITHRKQVIDWVRTQGVSDIFYHQNPDALWSYRTKTDLSYTMNHFPGGQFGAKPPSFFGRRHEGKGIKF